MIVAAKIALRFVVGLLVFMAFAAMLVLGVNLTESGDEGPDEPQYPSGRALDLLELERQIINTTNKVRSDHGAGILSVDENISLIARNHSEDMTVYGMEHVIKGKDATDRALEAGYDCRAYRGGGVMSYGFRENLAEYPRIELFLTKNSSWIPVRYHVDERSMADEIVEGWMDSHEHRKALLNTHNKKIGVGASVVVVEDNGWYSERFFVTQNFSECD